MNYDFNAGFTIALCMWCGIICVFLLHVNTKMPQISQSWRDWLKTRTVKWVSG